MNNKTTFWNYINKYKIEIPIIQRDYAQGRKGKEILRESFLHELKDALDGKIEELKLDFVYGSTDKETLNPLDGQQRLTTLWLLHWYIALRAKNDFDFVTNCEKLLNFTYETRISSREFCQNLCNPQNFENFDVEKERVVDYITRQTWFYSAWKQDPTIQSMLRMLGGTKENNTKGNNKKENNKKEKDIIDGIEELFCDSNDFQEYWKKLTSLDCPIVFYHLSLNDFGLSDDLYIKMNARGKQLTSFENFKADLIGYICNQTKNDSLTDDVKAKWKKLLDPTSGFPIKLDTTWTQLFWPKRSKGIVQQGTICKNNHIDEIYYTMLNRFFWNELFMASEGGDFLLDIGKGDENSTKEKDNEFYYYLNDEKNPKDFDIKIAYEGLDAYKYQNKGIPLSFFESVQSILNNLCTYLEKNTDLPKCGWEDKFYFIPEYEKEGDYNIEIFNNASEPILKVTPLSQPHRVVFFAMCKYFKKGAGDITSLTNWMRVVWNLVSGVSADGRPQIRSTQAMRVAMKYIDTLDSHDVYTALTNHGLISPKDNNLSEFAARFNEEVIKAEKILSNETRSDGKSWAEIINAAENVAFFNGTIRFLYENEQGLVNWDDFDTKLQNAKKYFESTKCPIIELAKYCDDYQLTTIWSTYTFDYKNWKTILINETIKNAVHNFLIGEKWSNNQILFTDIQNLLDSINDTNVRLILNWKDCGTVLTNYSTKRNEPYNGYVFEVGNEMRAKFNNVIKSLKNCTIKVPPAPETFEEKYEINDKVYYRGLWLDFIYKNYHFRYYGDNKIYLMTNEWEKATQTDDECSYYCFNVTKETLKAIEDELNNLIGRH